MAVKRTSAAQLRKREAPYTTISNSTVELIDDTTALAIWTYLQTKPAGWVVRSKDLQSRFKCGKEKIQSGMRKLRALGLVTDEQRRDEQGHILGQDIVVHYEPVDSGSEDPGGQDSRQPENPAAGKPGSRENRQPENPHHSNVLSSSNGLSVSNGHQDDDVVDQDDQQPPSTEEPTPFDRFWKAWPRKVQKKSARPAFERARKAAGMSADDFAEMLIDDIQQRIAIDQLGFDRMHPTTYLNGERWHDQLVGEAGVSAANDSTPECPHGEILSAWNKFCGDTKGRAPSALDWIGTKSADALAERWAEYFDTPDPVSGRVRYATRDQGIDWWSRAIQRIASNTTFQHSDVDVWSLFFKGVFAKAATDQLKVQRGAVR